MAVEAPPPVRSGAAWPSTLLEYGLGEELGAVKVIGPCSDIPANHIDSIAIDCKPPAHGV